MKMVCDFSHCRPKQPEGPAAIIPCSGEEESEELEFTVVLLEWREKWLV